MKPFAYQEDGVAFLAAHPVALLADEPGLGKTAQAILAAKALGLEKILVICPKTPMLNWTQEFRLWWRDGPLPTVLNYDLFSAKSPNATAVGIASRDWDLLILDEAHRLKNAGANRTKFVYRRVAPRARHKWLLTGTPTPNHNGELWTHLAALSPDLIRGSSGRAMSRVEFEDLYCNVIVDPRYGRRISGNRNTAELRERIAPIVLRRKKSQVLKDLPALLFGTLPLAMENLRALKQLPNLPPSVDPGDTDAVVAWLRSHPMPTERRLLGIAKAPAAAEAVEDALDAGNHKIILFAHHREVMDELQKRLSHLGLVRIDGQTAQADRDAAVHTFQTDPGCRVFLGQITACGEAITLTAASHVLFAETSWTPSDNYQAACRAHRIGQTNAVTAQFLTAGGTLDDTIARVLARKAQGIADLFG